MILHYSKTRLIDSEELVELFTSVGWIEESAKYPHRLENAIYYSSTVFSAWAEDKLVGLLSAIDDSMHVYITYFLVNPEYQNKEIGKTLLQMFDECYANYKKELKTVKTQDYYKKFGYEVDSVGMVKNDLPDYDI